MNQHTLDILEYEPVRSLLVRHATCGLGQRLARQIQPLTDRSRIERLIAETTELKALLAPSRELPMGGVHDLFPLFEKLEQGEDILLTEDIILISETLRSCRTVKGYFEDIGNGYPHLLQFAQSISIYPAIEDRITGTFTEGGVMKNSASPALRTLRKAIEQLRTRIRGRLQSVLRAGNVSPYLQDTSIRDSESRPSIAVKAQFSARVPGMRRGRSDSGNTVFIEPEAIVGMGDELEAARDAEKAEMVRILREITAMIAAQIKPLRETIQVLAHLDMTYAKVRLSRAFAMHPPVLNTDGVIRLSNARHPLLLALQVEREASDDENPSAPVVPIDVRLGEAFHTLIITGPNTGGKTVVLKTIGLLTLMAQSGMHIPADEGSTVDVFQYVAADIGDEQSIEQSLSTFSSHLTHIAEILSHAGPDSLVLLDELGGGTDPVEGAALARAILDYLHTRQTRTAVSTHISQLKQLGYAVPGIENASIEFDIETLQPTHRLMTGMPGSSNALAIAQRLGLPQEVIDHAERGAADDDTADLINAVQDARARAEEDRSVTAQARAEATRLEEEYRVGLVSLEAREAEMKAQPGHEAVAVLQKVTAQIEHLRKSEPSRRALLNTLEDICRFIAEPNAVSSGAAPSPSLHTGHTVRVRSLDRVGVLGEIDAPNRKAVVHFGPLPVTVSLDDVEAE